MPRCNFCSLRHIRIQAKRDGLVVRLVPSNFMGGMDVFSVPKGIGMAEIRTWEHPSDKMPNGCVNREKYAVSWMMEIPKQCVC